MCAIIGTGSICMWLTADLGRDKVIEWESENRAAYWARSTGQEAKKGNRRYDNGRALE